MAERPKHDQIFRKSMENPLVANEFFNAHLPKTIKELLDFSSIKMDNTTFVEPNLKDSITDVLFTAKLDKKDAYLYLLVEHQSSPDRFMAFRLFQYMINICDRYLTQNPKTKTLPLVYPMIFFNGTRKYNVSRNLWGLFEDKSLAKEIWTNNYQLVNVHEIPDEELKQRAWSGVMEFFMKHIHERELLKRWQEIADMLPELTNVTIGYNYIEMILSYTLTKIDQSDKIELQKLLTSTLNKETGTKLMRSLAQHWLEEGKAEGVQIGKAEGKIEIAKRMLAKGSDLAFISAITGLDEDFVLSLANSNTTYKSKL